MYTESNVTDDIIEIKDTELSFIDTKITYRYYNLKDHTSYMHPSGSKVGKDGLTPDKFTAMDSKSLDWAMKYYIPKLRK